MTKLLRFGALFVLACVFATTALDLSFAQTATATAIGPDPSTAGTVWNYAMAGVAVILMIAAVPIAYFATVLIAKMAQGVGISVTDSMKASLQQQIVNGIHWAAEKVKERGGHIDKETFLGKVLEYVQVHGDDLAKGLKLDPNSQQFKESVEARAIKAVNDPNTPTPPVANVIVDKPA